MGTTFTSVTPAAQLGGSPTSFGNKRVIYGKMTGPTSYTGGGIPVTAATFGLSFLEALYVVANNAAGAVNIPFVATNSNSIPTGVGLVVGSTGVEVAGAVDVSTSTFEYIAIGV